ncbi:aldo/keto reductase [Stutzerimonas azotifigens]|uniref:aldo/keto reductase n=1 Tax=Stutzerimonas azotifigens TaxID=291995 RepID=UPI00041712A1|nr:aldo/keto reductase [Stutzerimonas azotifigens]
MNPLLTRAEFLRLSGALLLSLSPAGHLLASDAERSPLRTRRIPASGEALPVIGVGTYRAFDISPEDREAWAACGEVLRLLFAAGGTVIDSSPMYGRAEATVGGLLDEMNAHARAFLATKVWNHGREAGLAQMEESLEYLQSGHIQLMQVHNLLDWRTQLATLREWKEQGRIRYLGVTHYTASAYPELEAVLRAEPLDFLQVNYSLDEPQAAQRILPLAQDRGVAVLVNRPFGGGNLLRRLLGQPLPAWAADYDCSSWPQLLLKFCLANPAVTCVIPGTGNPRHMHDNLQAGYGKEPDDDLAERLRGLL